MRRFLPLGLVLTLILTGGAARGQGKSVVPAAHTAPASKGRDMTKLPLAQQQLFVTAQRGMNWLRRTNRPDGRFVYGFLPALSTTMEGDDYLAQAGAGFALARAARYFGDDNCTTVARQALLTLLLETTTDAKTPQVRRTAAPPQLVNRLAAHGLLVLAIHELSAPSKDLLDQGDQLAQYLRQQQRTDGLLLIAEAGDDAKAAAAETHLHAAGLALHGIARSQRLRPASWKLDMLRKARACYVPYWKEHKNLPQALSHAPAWAEAYVLTKDQAYADAVFAMNDWLCGLQYQQVDPQRKRWLGGFPTWSGGKAVAQAPDIHSAACAECLAEACRVARAAGDLTRYRRYRRALEQCLMFLTTLQYTPARTRHFVEEFRPAIAGAFHGSHQDGNLRIDYTQHALSALVLYLEHAAD